MNKLEMEYSQQLEVRRRAGELLAWRYEAVKLCLGFNSWYTPDFLVLDAEGYMELHEVKGHMEEAARVRLKAAAHLFPWFTFRLARKVRGRWQITEVKSRG